MRKALAALLAALALSGCAQLENLDNAAVATRAAEFAQFATEATKRGVVLGDGIGRDEIPGYLAAAATTWGGEIPAEMRPWITEVCVASALIKTDLDAEAAAVCAGLMED